MQIKLILVGRIKEQYLLEGVREYSSRLAPYCTIRLIEVPDTSVPPQAGASRQRMAMQDEGRAIMARLAKDEYVVALDEGGLSMSSEEFSRVMADLGLFGKSKVTFIIGGHLGLSSEIKEKADMLLSLSKMTLPHQMVPMVLLEQIYRAMKIARGEPYHR